MASRRGLCKQWANEAVQQALGGILAVVSTTFISCAVAASRHVSTSRPFFAVFRYRVILAMVFSAQALSSAASYTMLNSS